MMEKIKEIEKMDKIITPKGNVLVPKSELEQAGLTAGVSVTITHSTTKVTIEKRSDESKHDFAAASYHMTKAYTLLFIGSIFILALVTAIGGSATNGSFLKYILLGTLPFGLFILFIGIREYFFANDYVEQIPKLDWFPSNWFNVFPTKSLFSLFALLLGLIVSYFVAKDLSITLIPPDSNAVIALSSLILLSIAILWSSQTARNIRIPRV